MIVFALFVSVVFGTLMRDEPKEQLRFGAQLFAAFVVGRRRPRLDPVLLPALMHNSKCKMQTTT